MQKHSELFDQFLQNAHLRQGSVLHQDPIHVAIKERRVLEEALQETTTIGMEYDDDRVSVLHDHDVEESSSTKEEGSSSEEEQKIMLKQATTTAREKKPPL